MYHHDPQHTGNVACSDITRATVAGLALRHTVGLNGHMISVPALVDGKIYAGSSIPGGGVGGGTLYRIDPHAGPGENLWGVFASAAVDPTYQNVLYGLGGYEGVDGASTPFMRVCDWTTLADSWPAAVGVDTVTRYTSAAPPMYQTSEGGLSSPVVVNDLVFVSTSSPATQSASLYAFSTSNGMLFWSAPGFVSKTDNPYSLGPAIHGNFVVVGAGSQVNIYGL